MFFKVSRVHVAIGAAMMLALFLRLQGLATESMWFDEVAQVEWNKKNFFTFLGERWDQVDPPLNEIVAWIYNNIVRTLAPAMATEEWVIRLPVLILGIITIPVVASAAGMSGGPLAAVSAAFLLAANPYHVRYSQEARMYALLIFFSACAMRTCAGIFTAAAGDLLQKRRAVALGLFWAAASLTHYYAFISLSTLAAAAFLLYYQNRDERAGALRRGALIGMAIVVPWIAAQAIYVKFTGHGTRPWLSGLGRPGLESLALSARAYAVDLLPAGLEAAGAGFLEKAAAGVAQAALGLLIILGAIRRAGMARGAQFLILMIAFAPCLMVFAVSQLRPLFHPRYLLAAMPAIVIIAALARPRALAMALTAVYAVLCTLLVARYHEYTEKPDYKKAGAVLAAEFQPVDEADVAFIDRLPLQYYAKQASGRFVGAPMAIEASAADRNIPPYPCAPNYKLREVRAGARLFEADLLPPWSRLYLMDSKKLYRERMLPPQPPATHKLLFESKPFPWLRLWVAQPAPR